MRKLCSRRLAWAVAAVGVAGGALTATQAFATDTSGNTVYACVSNQTGNVRIVAENATCSHNEYATSWNSQGQQGQAGATGATGATGAAGAAAPDPTPRAKVVGTLTLTPSTPGGATATPFSFDIYDFSSELDQTLDIGSSSSGAGAGKVTFTPITVTIVPDSNAPKLLTMLASGAHFSSAEVKLYGKDGSVAETFDYGLVALGSLTTTNSGAAEDSLFEKLTLNVGTTIQTVGSSTSGWDRVTNSGTTTITNPY